MELITKVEIAEPKERITLKDRILMLGSCFADEIGELLKIYGFNICVNPFGTLYNPVSVTNSLERLLSGAQFTEQEVIVTGPRNAPVPLYCSFSHHSRFSRPSPKEFLENANHSLQSASQFIKEANIVIITLGTAWVFRHIGSAKIVSNCHKIEPKEFERLFLDIEEVVSLIEPFLIKCPNKNFIFTVSPIRHLKDGAHGNQISKATLLLALEKLMQKGFKNMSYFPSYELLLDELRDYRFYAEDMTHPSAQAVKYIFEKFKESFIAHSEYQTMQLNLKRYKQSAHIPLHR